MGSRKGLGGALVLLLVCGAGFGLWRLKPRNVALPTQAVGGRVELAAGRVELRHGEAFEPVASGTPLGDDAALRTGPGARTLLRLVGGPSAFVDENTTLALRGGGLSLTAGRLFLDAPESPEPVVHHIGDVSVTAADAGLSIQRGEKGVEVYVARGLAVVAASGGRREVAAGEQASVDTSGGLVVGPAAFWDDWTGGMADRGIGGPGGEGGAGAGRLYAVDRQASPGTRSLPLEVKRQAVNARIADGMAETEVDQTFFNPSDRPVEGWYWFTVPEAAIVTGFSLETNGVLVAGEVVERKEAAAKYEAAVQNTFDPALLEWIDGRSYRARIYPVPALGTRRVVLRYVELASSAGGTVRYLYPMAVHGPGGPDGSAIGEFSLSVTLETAGKGLRVSTLPDAKVEDDGRRVTMRRSVYTPRGDFQLEATPSERPEPLRVRRFSAGGDQADFVMIRYVPDVDWAAVKPAPAEVVLAVDTSASGDEADHQLKAQVAEAILRSLSADDTFALLTADMSPHVIFPEAGAESTDTLAPATSQNIARAIEHLAERTGGGATDLGSIFDPALRRLNRAEQPAVIYIGDGVATSGEIRGQEVVERLRRALEGSRARFFTLGVGGGANHALLQRLAAVGGGEAFRVDSQEEAVPQALRLSAAVKTPTLTDFTLDVGVGLDEPLSNVTGKIPRGRELVLLARTHHDLPAMAKIHGRIGGMSFDREQALVVESGAATPMVPLLWAAEFAQRLLGSGENPEAARGRVVALGLDYGLMTPFSSILALESDEAYGRMGIPRKQRQSNRLAVNDAGPVMGLAGQVASVALAPLAVLTGCTSNAPDLSKSSPPASMAPVATGASPKADVSLTDSAVADRLEAKNNAKWALKGPPDQAEVQLAKERAKLSAVASAGAAFNSLEGEMAEVWGAQGQAQGADAVSGFGRGGGGYSELGAGNLGTAYGRAHGDAQRELLARVIPGEPAVSGSLDRAVVTRILRQHGPEYRYCYEKELNLNRALSGRLTAKFTIAGNGGVVAVNIEGSTLRNTGIEQCLIRHIMTWSFPEPRGGGLVIVKYPFVFQSDASPAQIAAPTPPPPVPPPPRPAPPAFPCSDVSARPLPDRMVLWSRMLHTADTAAAALSMYDVAQGHCELPGWRDRRAFLGLLDPTVRSAEAAETVMTRFDGDREALEYLGRRILRRNLDPYITAVVSRHLAGGQTNWQDVDAELALLPDDNARIAHIQDLLRASPDDAAGELRLVKWYDRAGKRPQALEMARKLRERGLMSPSTIRLYGDLMADMDRPEDALRAYSEIVEFDADNSGAHRLVGDILLGRGWYETAYREYRTLTDMAPEDALGHIRLALSAAGAGRVDEALRLLRGVAEGDGKPGADDPRAQARMISGALIARQMADTKADPAQAEALVRRLKQLQLLTAPGRLVILTWENLDTSLAVAQAAPDGTLDAPEIGLFAFRGQGNAVDTLDALKAAVDVRTEKHDRQVGYTLHEIVFDGKAFTVKILAGQVAG